MSNVTFKIPFHASISLASTIGVSFILSHTAGKPPSLAPLGLYQPSAGCQACGE